MSKPTSFYSENCEIHHFVPEVEFNEIKAKCNKNKSKSCFHKNLYPTGILKAKYYMDDEGFIWLKNVVDNKFIEIFYEPPADIEPEPEAEEEEEEEKGIFNGICNCNHTWDKDSDCICKDDDSEEEEEYEYTAYGSVKLYKVVINVAGGGMMNGNAYANIEGEWETEEEYETGEEGDIYYCEYGNNPVRRYVGTRIVWGEDDNFNVE